MGPGSAEPPAGGSGRGEWRVTDEFRQRLGCGLGAAVALPAWFAVIALALGRDVTGLAVVVAAALFVVSAVLGVSAVRRLRALPSLVALDGDGWLRISGRHVSMALPVDAVREVEVGAAVGLESVRLHTHQGRTVRLPGDLGDLDGFLAALAQAHRSLVLRDHRTAVGGDVVDGPDRGEVGDGGAPGSGGRLDRRADRRERGRRARDAEGEGNDDGRGDGDGHGGVTDPGNSGAGGPDGGQPPR